MILGEKMIRLSDKPVTHIVVAAHPDDVEIMCGAGIASCYKKENQGLLAVIVSDGGGSPRSGEFENYTYEEMVKQRRIEQINAAKKGDFTALIMLSHTSADINQRKKEIADEIKEIIESFSPKIVYTHNPADKHRTHVSVFLLTLEAVRNAETKIEKFYGCECWRGLDWLTGEDKIIFDLTGYDELLTELLNEHVSQVQGGKRYDLAAEGRRKANATFLESHSTDKPESCSYAMDLMPLAEDKSLAPEDFIAQKIDNLKADILSLIKG